ncbi:hypothetical protein COT87_02005 [Candidatus Collierbacteria bacterium CG10_big_fil_rev_8_21_14_0_10_44_9]|uniref:Glycosyltransferase RgtA/B/C/D-like domain-containing protein n=1 Tax=Candidatus Collierbacteria bacterium CG10_big_fil_rev_8_21_14_0_10_44_9 TaxID=1974535 RepID=A0A2H0VIQ2_9BACT|nr:MAG: hypothetical protein COT87_02005 [Candidatus Collierbacteria bacterium CG10_big_fil_rev_8_21_14_0_10_44_9]
MFYILALATILRLILLNQSLWLDESIQALALMGKMGPLMQYALADYQPPLYHLIGYAFTQLFGYSEIALRLPSIISGLFTVYFVVKIGEVIGNRKIGLIAGLLAATNPLLIYYSQEGRTYALTTFFVTASFYHFMLLLKQKSTKSYLLYSLFTTAFLWTSYLSWFVMLAQGIYALWKKRYDILSLQIGATLTLFAWLPSFISSLSIGQSTLVTSPAWGTVVGGLSWKSLPLTWVKFVIGRISFDNKIIYGVLVGIIGFVHLLALRLVDFKKNHLLLLWLIPPVILGIFTAGFLPVYQYFRVLFILPAYLLLLALGLSKFKVIYPTVLVIVIQFILLGYYWVSPRYHREDWRQLVRDIPPNATLALPSRAQNAPLLYYGWDKPILEPSHDVLVGQTIYYIRYVEDLFDGTRLGQANFAKSGYTITSQKSYSGIQLDIYEKWQ